MNAIRQDFLYPTHCPQMIYRYSVTCKMLLKVRDKINMIGKTLPNDLHNAEDLKKKKKVRSFCLLLFLTCKLHQICYSQVINFSLKTLYL